MIFIEIEKKKIEESAKLEGFFHMYGDQEDEDVEEINNDDLKNEIDQLMG